jgi:hypothetical protein
MQINTIQPDLHGFLFAQIVDVWAVIPSVAETKLFSAISRASPFSSAAVIPFLSKTA